MAAQGLLTARCGASAPGHAVDIVERCITDYLGWVPYTQLANITGRPP